MLRPFCFDFFKVNTLRVFTILVLLCSVQKSLASGAGGCTIDSVSIQQPLCYGDCNGSVTVFATGVGPLIYSYPDIPGANSSVVSNLCPGTYEVVITDSTGCTSSALFDIIEPAPIQISFLVGNTSCPGGCSGFLTVVPVDTTVSYLFQWPGFANTTPTLGNICQGIYAVVVTDPSGCSITETEEVGFDDPFSLNLAFENSTCLSSCNGTATVVANGIPPFTYSWSTGPIQQTQTAVGLCAGPYTVTVQDSTGCQVSGDVIIGVDAPPAIATAVANPVCAGTCTGQAIATVTSPGSYLFEWSTLPVQVNDTAVNLCAGVYYLTVIDVLSGCTYLDSVIVDDPLPPSVQFATTPAICNNFCTGSATIISAGGIPPFTYLWQTGSTTEADSALCPGIYAVTITDSTGCATITSVEVPGTSLNFTTTDATCNAICDGTATVDVPFVSEWNVSWNTSPVQNSLVATNLCYGDYDVLLVDSSGCIVTGEVTVDFDNPITHAVTATAVSCYGSCDGVASVIASGNSPLSYSWNTIPPSFTDTVTDLCTGNYELTITDSAGCSVLDFVFIDSPDEILFSFNAVDASCGTLCDGAAVIFPSAPGSYIYEWQTSPVQYGSAVSGICPGFTVVDITVAGCSYQDSVFINSPLPINVSLSQLDITCNGECDGFIDVFAFGGSPGYSYQWSHGPTTEQVLNLCAGIYTVTVTDITGCTNSNTTTIIEPDSISIAFQITNASCATCADGSLTAIVTGGTPPYSYLWNPGGLGSTTIDSVLTGFYSLCVADDNLCLKCDSAFVDFFDALNEVQAGSYSFTNVFPNPFKSESRLLVVHPDIGNGISPEMIITDLTGRMITDFSLTPLSLDSGQAVYGFRFENKAPGVYLFHLQMNGKRFGSGKFIIL